MTFQSQVNDWMQACFGAEISADKLERGDRLLEEVFELLQSGDYPRERVAALTDYVWNRPVGEPKQEAGGVMVTMAAYCLAHDLDMQKAGDDELARVWTKVEAIRAKQAAKPTGSALPVAEIVEPAGPAPYHRGGIGDNFLQIALAEVKEYVFSPDEGADHYPSDFEQILLHDFVLSLTGHEDFNREMKRAQAAINGKSVYVAVDYLGCIYSSEDYDAVVSVAHTNAGSVGRQLGIEVPLSKASFDVLAERHRQIKIEGWTAEHDDEHADCSIAQAAAAYAYAASGTGREHGRLWPWSPKWWKPGDARRMLVKAAALILAEIERLDRKADRETPRG